MLRRFLLLSWLTAFIFDLLLAGNVASADEARKAAAWRPRRVIFNNDGDDALHYSGFTKAPASKEGLLAIRMDHVNDCGIDSVFYCTTQSFNYFTHDSKVTEVFTTKEGAFVNNMTAELIGQGADPLKAVIEACRRDKREVFWTHRLNDIHDNFWPEMMSQWKKDHPQFLTGKPQDKEKYQFSDPAHVWTFVDFANRPARDATVAAIADVLARYDVDGIDLDFLRHPAFFRETIDGRPVTAEHREMLTQMIHDVRREVLAASDRKGKPILLSVRIFPTLELNRQFGLDIEQWAADGLMDILALGGGYDPFTMPVEGLIQRGHDWSMPVYVCLSESGFDHARQAVPGGRVGSTPECWRAAAANAWRVGADGIMTFNLFPNGSDSSATHRVQEIWRDIGNRDSLNLKNKLYAVENLAKLNDIGFMVRSVPVGDRLPVDVAKGTTVERVLQVADNLTVAKRQVATLQLRLHFSGFEGSEVFDAEINQQPVTLRRDTSGWWLAEIAPEAVLCGANRITLHYHNGPVDQLAWTGLELVVSYLDVAGQQRELESKSARGLFARMWRTSADPSAKAPSHPSLVRANSGQLLLLLTDVPSPEQPGVLALCNSNDDGRTWSEPQVVYTSPSAVPKACGTLTRLASGSLVAPFVDEPGKIQLLVSVDDGITWTPSEPIRAVPLENSTPYGPLIELDGAILMSVFGHLPADGGKVTCSGLLRSTDGGKTWGDFSAIARGNPDSKTLYGPTAVYADHQGTLLALICEGDTFLCRSISTDGGKSWSPPERRLLACNPSLAVVGSTLACVSQDSQLRGMVRVQFSDNLFDSWRCDRMLDFDIRGQFSSALALDEDRLLLAHDRGGFKPEGNGTPVTEGIEVALMQRNPAAPSVSQPLIPSNERDRWEFAERLTVPMLEGLGVTTMAPDGRFLTWSGGQVYAISEFGKKFTPICQAPKSPHNSGIFGVLRSGRWLIAYPDWTGVDEAADWSGRRERYTGPDGYLYEKLTGVKGVNKLWVYFSDDQGKTWQGGEQSIPPPLVWSNPEGRFIEEADGTILMTTYGCLSPEDTDRHIDCCGIFRSTDGGKTWGDFSLVAYDSEFHEKAYNEMDIQPMPDGTWLAMCRTEWRTHHAAEPSSSSVCYSVDHGRTWTKPEFAFIGAVPDLTLLPDGGLFWIGSSHRARISYDGGHTWSVELPAMADSGATGYPGADLVDQNHLFICTRWQGRGGCIYRRIPASNR